MIQKVSVYILLGLLILIGSIPILAAILVALVLFYPVAFLVALYAVLRLIVLTVYTGVNDFTIKRLSGTPRRR
jgi:hypothetical protein